MVAPILAVKAYAAAQEIGGAGGLPGASGPAAGPDFSQMVNQAVNSAVTDSRGAESAIQAQVSGKASLVDVVTALSQAQTSLSTMIAVRNQMIGAYQQIMSMAI
jgi:flagellar hook-basal body complex protein FliE